MNILVRADSSSTIGTGHIMRDLVLVEQLKDANIVFASQNLPGSIYHKIREKNYKIEILDSNDFEELNALISKLDINMIVIDHYGIDEYFEKKLKENYPKLKIFVFDDTYEKHYCDILLNINLYADSSQYKNLVPNNCELRCGTEHMLLRDEFVLEKQKGRKNKKNNLNVFIAMGGADHTNLNIKILETLKHFKNIHVNVVTTTANQYLNDLQKYVEDKENITLHINTDQIAKLMNEADFAIVTPSVTVNEIVYMEVPFIAIKTASNQNEMYKYLAKKNYLVLENFNETDLINKIKRTTGDSNIELVNFINLSLEEKKIILGWRNHPSISKCMFTQEKISLDKHLNYIDSLDTKEDRIYFLVKKASQSIGVIDFTNIDYKNKRTEFGVYSDPMLKGVGNFLMESIINYAFNILKFNTLISEVFEDNIPAIKLYKRYDFTEVVNKNLNDKNVIRMELKNENR